MVPHSDDPVIRIASTPVITLRPRATLREAAAGLRAGDVGALAILGGDDRPLAVISERDIVRALAEGADPDEVWADDVMTEDPRYATPGQSIRSVGDEMLAAGVRHMPIVDDGQIVGLVAGRDVLRVLTAADAHEPELAHLGG